MLINVK